MQNTSPPEIVIAGYPIAPRKYRLKITDHFLDNVYGQIGVTEVERKLERLPLFKRLHNISQLGLTNWIFPCALHTRYVHSIGVMHTAYNMALHINKNKGDFFSDDEMQIIRLAGMLHDIGHYPLSHNIETAYKYGNQEKKYFDNNKVCDHLKELVGCPEFLFPEKINEKCPDPKAANEKMAKYLKGWDGSKNFHHEAIGRSIIINNKEIHNKVRDEFVLMKIDERMYLNPAFKPISDDEDFVNSLTIDDITSHLLEAIAAMVVGNYEYSFRPITYEYEKKFSAMIQLIHSDMDADNLDYLLRDATFSGTSYGTMDVNVLMNCLTVAELQLPGYSSTHEMKDGEGTRQSGERNCYLVGIMPKGVGCVEQFFQNKYLAYSQMIFSKYVSILEAMILNWAMVDLPRDKVYGTEHCAETGKGLKTFAESKETQEQFLHFTDSYVIEKFRGNYELQQDQQDKMQGKPFPLGMTILSRLTNYVAFNLADEPSEALCVGWSQGEIKDSIRENGLYQQFLEAYEKVKDLTVREYYGSDEAKELFAFRFENYSMTKQIPLDVFCCEYIDEAESLETKTHKHYYRLANGVPILEKSQDTYCYKDEGTCKYTLPKLIVDTDSSVMRKTYQQQFVYLRKYNILDYTAE